jgi:hypothetical protein
MEPAETVVKEWLQNVKKQFTMKNIPYAINSEKLGRNYGDIDFLGVDTKGKFYDYDVKWSNGPAVGSTKNASVDGIIAKFNDSGRKEVLCGLEIDKGERILIVPKIIFWNKEETRTRREARVREEKISIVYFDTVIDDLINHSKSQNKDNSTVIRLIRSVIQYLPGFQKMCANNVGNWKVNGK